ncbi:uncharacterized protein METZ01_LOCUS508742, partial [marine metagenome]
MNLSEKYSLTGVLFLLITACGSPAEKEATGTTDSMVNSVGRQLPADAAPLDEQVFRQPLVEPSTLDVGIALFDAQFIA